MNKQQLDNAVSDRNQLKEVLAEQENILLKQNYKGVWVEDDEIKKFDVVYVDASGKRTFYIAKNDIDESSVSPALDIENWQELFETVLSSETKKYLHTLISTNFSQKWKFKIFVISNSQTPFTFNTFKQWLIDNGYTWDGGTKVYSLVQLQKWGETNYVTSQYMPSVAMNGSSFYLGAEAIRFEYDPDTQKINSSYGTESVTVDFPSVINFTDHIKEI